MSKQAAPGGRDSPRARRRKGAQAAPPTAAGLAARAAALWLLQSVLDERRLLDAAITDANGPVVRLAPADRAFAQRLASATLRHLAAADAVLAPHLRKPPKPPVRHALRLAVTEVFALATPAHAAVHAAVSATHARRDTAALSGFVNAVLRRAIAEGAAVWAAQPPQPLPGWLRGRLQSAYGRAAVAAMEAAYAAHPAEPPRDLTPAQGDPAALAAAVGGRVLPTGSVRLDASGQVSALPGFAEGAFWVQDAAAALPALALAPRPGERVLDLCAAPGGKTLQCAAAGATVTALDIAPARLDRLRENLARTGLAAAIVAADALDWVPEALFDAILLDAPCTATGTIRRHPDLPFLRRSADVKPLVALQTALIDRAVAWLRPGGRLVYCTCSLLPDEGEAAAAAALSRHADLRPDPAALDLPGVDPGWQGPHGLRLRPDFWPEAGGIDGFFIAAFRNGMPGEGGGA